MCGITGTLNWQAPPDVMAVRRMTTCLAHRGPDAEGISELGPVVLGHRRLSIIDVSETNNQPLPDASGQVWIVFNGEIYNYRELRSELQAHGATFRTQGDTEVILEAYRRWGDDCLTRLNGMFAFALWDEARQRLLVARDRAGEKPLYYQPLPGGGLAFASELKALRLHPAVSSRINPAALGHYLSINYTLTEACIIEGVQKLPAAHYLVAERDRPLKVAQYWDLAAAFRQKRVFRSEEDAADELRALLDDAVRLRLVSDVPLGAFLSGGIDSSAIVAAMAKLGNPRDVRAFTIGFNEQTFDELPQARVVAQTLAIDHYERVVDVDMAKALPTIVAASDEPFADTSAIPVYYLAEFARQHVTVALSGDGSDEILAGYETYAADRVLRLTRRLPRRLMYGLKYLAEHGLPVSFDNVSLDYRLRKFLRGQPLGPRRAHYYWRIIFEDADKRRLLRPAWRETAGQADPFDTFHRYHLDVKDCDFLDQALYVDFKTWLVDDILVKVDRATMAHSLESRAPFLDHRLVELAAALPADFKLKRMRKKHLLKQSQVPRLPRSVIDRKKQGFNTPVSQWYTGGMLALAQHVTTDPSLGEWFEPSEIDRLWREHLARKEDHGLKLFGLTCFGLWIEQLRGASR